MFFQVSKRLYTVRIARTNKEDDVFFDFAHKKKKKIGYATDICRKYNTLEAPV